MEAKLVYQFPDHRFANRFLADVQSGTIAYSRAKRDSNDERIAVTLLPLPSRALEATFDDRAQALDNLALVYEGYESP